ncbi:MAG TPA: class I SAM-dependent methyltransferase [Roseiflexaceae bacterium]|nr:class I SAM-dependent methyltransferase [Roseiflexaceae bacterium]
MTTARHIPQHNQQQIWQRPDPSAQEIDLVPLALKLTRASVGKAVWDGIRIGALHGLGMGLLGSESLGIIFLGALIGPLLGAVLGLCVGLSLGLLCGIATTILSRAAFYPLRDWPSYRWYMGLLHMALAVGSLGLLYTNLGLEWNIFNAMPSDYDIRHILFMLGLTYIPALIVCVYSWFHADRLARRYVDLLGLLQDDELLTQADIYDPQFQHGMFNALARRYDLTSSVASLGLDSRLRADLAERMDLSQGMAICDLMSGGGEMWPHLLPPIGPDGRLTAVEYAPAMQERARRRRERLPNPSTVTLHAGDAFATRLPAESFDAVVCAFGLKTLSPAQLESLLNEIQRILRPNGIFGFVELSRPDAPRLRRWMGFYLARVVPALSGLVGADRRPYLLLGRYLGSFDSSVWLLPSLRRRGFVYHRYQLLGGCATALVGMKA